MKIHVDTPDGRHIRIPLPGALLLNGMLIKTVLKSIKVSGASVPDSLNQIASQDKGTSLFTDQQLQILTKSLKTELKTLHSRFGTLTLVDVKAADGTLVKIEL